jgi:hypothetical protein
MHWRVGLPLNREGNCVEAAITRRRARFTEPSGRCAASDRLPRTFRFGPLDRRIVYRHVEPRAQQRVALRVHGAMRMTCFVGNGCLHAGEYVDEFVDRLLLVAPGVSRRPVGTERGPGSVPSTTPRAPAETRADTPSSQCVAIDVNGAYALWGTCAE